MNAKIADQKLKDFVLNVVNAVDRQVDGSDDYLARKYRQFFPTRDRDIQLMAQLFWRVKDPNDPFLRKEIGEILCRAVIGELRDRLRAVWLAEYDNVAEWRLFMLQLQVHQVTNVEDQQSRHLYPPSPDTPIDLAIDWLRRNLLMLRVCRNPDCASPFFVASSAQKGLCSAACIAVAQKVHKRRWWTKERASPTHKRESDQSPVEQEIEDPSMVSGSGTGVAEGGQVAGHSLKARPGAKLRRETARVSGGESERTLKRFLHNVVNAPENRVDHLVSTYAKFFPSQTRTERLLTHQMNQDLMTSETLGTIKKREKRQALEQLRESLQSIWNADDTHTARWRLFTLQAELHRSTDPEVYGSDEELFPPPADRPVHQALELLRRNLHMLKECGNAACQTFRLFIASKGGQKYCSTSCTTAAQQEFKTRWWKERGQQWRKSRPAKQKTSRKTGRQGR